MNLSGWRERGFYGRGYRVKHDIAAADLLKRLHITLDHEVEILEHQFMRNGVDTVRGSARFTDAHHVEIPRNDGETVTAGAERFVIAVGTRPYRPDHIGFDGARVLDSDEILDLAAIPRQLTVIGASVIGVEYASIFSALDIKVTLLEPTDRLLPFVDRELADEFKHDLRDRGVMLRFGCKVTAAFAEPGGRCVTAHRRTGAR